MVKEVGRVHEIPVGFVFFPDTLRVTASSEFVFPRIFHCGTARYFCAQDATAASLWLSFWNALEYWQNPARQGVTHCSSVAKICTRPSAFKLGSKQNHKCIMNNETFASGINAKSILAPLQPDSDKIIRMTTNSTAECRDHFSRALAPRLYCSRK